MPDNAREIFVKNLRYLMEAKGITQADICRELDVSSATVSDWCSGKKYPRVDKMQRLADLFGVLFSTLTTESGIQDYENQMRIESFRQNPKLRVLYDRMRNVPDEDQDRMCAIFESILTELYGK